MTMTAACGNRFSSRPNIARLAWFGLRINFWRKMGTGCALSAAGDIEFMVTSRYILHSLFDLCGLQSPWQDPAKSLFNDALKPPQTCRVEDFYGIWHDLASVPIPID